MADTPRLTVRCEYPDTDMPPTEVTFRLSPSYGLLTATDVHNWFVSMLEEHGAGRLDRTALEERLAGRHQVAQGRKSFLDRDVQGAVQDNAQRPVGVVLPNQDHRVAEVQIVQATAGDQQTAPQTLQFVTSSRRS